MPQASQKAQSIIDEYKKGINRAVKELEAELAALDAEMARDKARGGKVNANDKANGHGK